MDLTIQRVRQELAAYGVLADDSMCGKIVAYVELLLRWNSKISLTTVTDPVEIVRFHFGESLFGANQLEIKNGRLADVGAGAGFPGVPLKLYSAPIELYLIEPNLKKATFLGEVVRHLNLDRVEILRFRMEDLPVDVSDFDVVTARALGKHGTLLRWARNRLSRSGKVALWIGDRDASSLASDQSYEWCAPIKVPRSDHRVILQGTPKLT
jgi:16S rRNA (guanine527-N7)-methyltransferase